MIINPYIFGGFDADALAFITATGITDTTQKNALNTFVLDLKRYSIWTKMKALYPFIGGTATTHKYNLKDPRDLDAAFRIVWNGGVTHSSNGVLFNGTTGYGDTKLNPSVGISSLNSTHISIYSRSNNVHSGVDMSASSNSNTQILDIEIYWYGNRYYENNAGFDTGVTASRSDGYFVNTRIASNQYKGFRNGSNEKTISITSVGLPNANMYIGCTNNSGTPSNYSNRQMALASIGDGLTNTDVANLTTAVNTYQTSLSRNV